MEMNLIQNKTKEELLKILTEEYPKEDKKVLEKIIDKITLISLHLTKKFFSSKKNKKK